MNVEKLQRRANRLSAREARPAKTEDEVYVSGKFREAREPKYHDTWCSAVNGVWLSGSNNIRVLNRLEAIRKGYVPCNLCQAPKSGAYEAHQHMDAICGR